MTTTGTAIMDPTMDPNATQDGTWTADDYAPNPTLAAILSAMPVCVACDPRELRGVVGGEAGEFNRVVRGMKGTGRVVVTIDGMLWRHW